MVVGVAEVRGEDRGSPEAEVELRDGAPDAEHPLEVLATIRRDPQRVRMEGVEDVIEGLEPHPEVEVGEGRAEDPPSGDPDAPIVLEVAVGEVEPEVEPGDLRQEGHRRGAGLGGDLARHRVRALPGVGELGVGEVALGLVVGDVAVEAEGRDLVPAGVRGIGLVHQADPDADPDGGRVLLRTLARQPFPFSLGGPGDRIIDLGPLAGAAGRIGALRAAARSTGGGRSVRGHPVHGTFQRRVPQGPGEDHR